MGGLQAESRDGTGSLRPQGSRGLVSPLGEAGLGCRPAQNSVLPTMLLASQAALHSCQWGKAAPGCHSIAVSGGLPHGHRVRSQLA